MADGCRLNLLLIHISVFFFVFFGRESRLIIFILFDEFHFQIPLLILLLFSSNQLPFHFIILCVVASGINKALSSFPDSIQKSHMCTELRI